MPLLAVVADHVSELLVLCSLFEDGEAITIRLMRWSDGHSILSYYIGAKYEIGLSLVMVDNREDNTNIEVKNLSEDAIQRLTYGQTLDLCKRFVSKIMIPVLFEKGRTEGKSIRQIREDIEELGISYQTMMRYAPAWSKITQKHGERTKRVIKMITQPNSRLILEDEEPNIPAPQYEVIEHRPQVAVGVTAEQKTELKEYRLQLQFIKSAAWSKAVGWAAANGDDYLVFVLNKRDELVLRS